MHDLASSTWGDASHAWPRPGFWAPRLPGDTARGRGAAPALQARGRGVELLVGPGLGTAEPRFPALGAQFGGHAACRAVAFPPRVLWLKTPPPRHGHTLLLKTPKSHPRELSGAEVLSRPPAASHGGGSRGGKRCSLAQGSALPSGGRTRLGAGEASGKPPASGLGGGGSFFSLSCCQKGKLLHETRGGAARGRFPKAFRSVSQGRIPRGALASCSLHRGRGHPRALPSTKAPPCHPLSASAPSDFGLADPSSWSWRVPRPCPSAAGRRGGAGKSIRAVSQRRFCQRVTPRCPRGGSRSPRGGPASVGRTRRGRP